MNAGSDSALNFKPNVDELESSEDEGEEGAGVYKAPRIAAQHYHEPGCETRLIFRILRHALGTFQI